METTEQFTLPNKQVNVRYIKRKKGMAAGSWVTEDHAISGGMLNKAFKGFPAPLLKNGSIANVLTDAEKEFLEDLMNVNLSVYKNKEFWETRQVRLLKGDNRLDLSNPIDYIDYKILLANKDKIAPSLKEKDNKLTYMFVIIDENEEADLTKEAFNYKKEAFKLYSKVEDNKQILRGIVKIINKKPLSENTTMKWLNQQVENIIDSQPEKFVSLLQDSLYETKILLSDAEDAGVVVTQNRRYMTSDGIELCYEGELASYDNTIKYLSDPLNQELVDIIKAKILKSNS